MAAITNITGATWPTSGAATTGTTGLQAVSGLTHFGSADVPPGSGATGYLKGVDGAVASFKLDANANVLPATGSTYWMRFWVRFATTGLALPADNQSVGWQFCTSSCKFQMYAGAKGSNRMTAMKANVLGATTESVLHPLGSNWTGNCIPYDRWFEYAIRIYKHATAGEMALYVNGQLTNISTNENTLATFGTADVTVKNDPTAGIRMEYCGPMVSCNDSDAAVLAGTGAISMRPRWSIYEAASDVVMSLPTHTPNRAGGMWTTLSGNVASVASGYFVTGGFCPAQSRFSFIGDEEVRSIDNLGTLPYRNDWATVRLNHLYVPAGTVDISVMNAGNTAALLAVQIAGGKLKLGGVDQATVATNKRYELWLHFSQAGQASFTLQNLTDGFAATTHMVSGSLGTWTSGALGQIRIAVVRAGTNVEIGGVMVVKALTQWGPDSFAEFDYVGIAPAMAGPNRIAGNFCGENGYGGTVLVTPTQAACLPGGAYVGCTPGIYSMPRMVHGVIGRSGLTIKQFTQNVLPNLSNTHNLRLAIWPSINDLNIGGINDGNRNGKVAEVLGYFRSLLSTLLPLGNEMWIITAPRHEGTTWSEQTVQAENLINAGLRDLAAKYQTATGQVWFSEAGDYVGDHATLFAGSDNTHMMPDSDTRYADEIARSRTVPAWVDPMVVVTSAGAFRRR